MMLLCGLVSFIVAAKIASCLFTGHKLPLGHPWFCATVFLFDDRMHAMTDL